MSVTSGPYQPQPAEKKDWMSWLFLTENKTFQMLLTLFWVYWLVAAILWIGGDIKGQAGSEDGLTAWSVYSAFSPWITGPIWWLTILFQDPLRKLGNKFRTWTIPYFIFGMIYYDILMEGFAVSWQGDMHPNIWISNFFWAGCAMAVLLGWYLMAYKWRMSAYFVFFVYGLKGVLVEQNGLVPKVFSGGDYYTGILLIPFLLVVYAVAVAPVFVFLNERMPQAQKKAGVGAAIVGFSISYILFYGGAKYWWEILRLLHVPAVPPG